MYACLYSSIISLPATKQLTWARSILMTNDLHSHPFSAWGIWLWWNRQRRLLHSCLHARSHPMSIRFFAVPWRVGWDERAKVVTLCSSPCLWSWSSSSLRSNRTYPHLVATHGELAGVDKAATGPSFPRTGCDLGCAASSQIMKLVLNSSPPWGARLRRSPCACLHVQVLASSAKKLGNALYPHLYAIIVNYQ